MPANTTSADCDGPGVPTLRTSGCRGHLTAGAVVRRAREPGRAPSEALRVSPAKGARGPVTGHGPLSARTVSAPTEAVQVARWRGSAAGARLDRPGKAPPDRGQAFVFRASGRSLAGARRRAPASRRRQRRGHVVGDVGEWAVLVGAVRPNGTSTWTASACDFSLRARIAGDRRRTDTHFACDLPDVGRPNQRHGWG